MFALRMANETYARVSPTAVEASRLRGAIPINPITETKPVKPSNPVLFCYLYSYSFIYFMFSQIWLSLRLCFAVMVALSFASLCLSCYIFFTGSSFSLWFGS